MKIFNVVLISLLTLYASIAQGQEVLIGFGTNQQVSEFNKKAIHRQKSCGCNSTASSNPKTLPFFEDFTTSKVVPDTNRWLDRNVFVNDDFAFHPLNKGVATFDALDSTGNIYKDADYIAFSADILTSRPLRLDSVFTPLERKLSPADSLWFSFYYQPQGRANEPEPWDTLLLEFSYFTGDTVFSHVDSIWVSANTYLENENDTIHPFDTLWAPPGCNPNMYKINYQTLVWGDWVQMPCDSVMVPERKWKTVWKSEGLTLQEFQQRYGTDFKRVMIPVKDSDYFFKEFQFRFRNYASIANDIIPSWKSNADQWNVDLIYLNYNRTYTDTTFRMLTFSERAPSFLKRYEVMPYRQYRADPINSLSQQVHMYISNLDKVEHNTKYRYDVFGSDGTYYYGYDGGSCNLPPVYTFGFQDCNTSCGSAHACPPVLHIFNTDYSVDTASFVIKHYISDSSESNILVDSAIYRQGFYNYFAYDDGTPELGYSLEPSGAELGYRFKLNMADTLWGVQILFNHTQNNANSYYFTLKVWSDNNGKPGELLYSEEGKKVEWNDDEVYGFYPYIFEQPLMVSGTIYVGFEQEQPGGLNVGFDANRDAHENIWYNVEDTWYQSNYAGALLIRPIIGSSLILGNNAGKLQNKPLFYPNPASGKLFFKLPEQNRGNTKQVTVYSLYGAEVRNFITPENYVDITGLSDGMYIMRIVSGNSLYTGRFMKKSR